MRFVSLFAGIGGIDLGLERAGWTCVGQVEIDPFCRAVLARHWPAVRRWEDVRNVAADDLRGLGIDAIVGGFPCQDISVAGRGAGIDGEKSGLWAEMHRLVREVRPGWVLAENVPALRTRGADRVLGDLEAAGYACWPLVVGARHVGAPHRRDRVWIVGRLANSESERRAREGGRRQGPIEGVDSTGAGLADPAGTGRGPAGDRVDADAVGAGARGGAAGTGPRLADSDGGHLRQQSGRRGWAGGADPAEPGDSPGALAGGGGDGLADADSQRLDRQRRSGLLDGERQACGDDTDGRRSAWPARPGQPQHGWEADRASTIESDVGGAAHGLPARLARRNRRARLKALGNSVVPQVVEAIGRAILAVVAA